AFPVSKGIKVLKVKRDNILESQLFPAPIERQHPNAIVFSTNDRLVAAAYPAEAKGKGRIIFWDLTRQMEVRRIETDSTIEELAFNPDSSRLAAKDGKGMIRFFWIADGREEWQQFWPSL